MDLSSCIILESGISISALSREIVEFSTLPPAAEAGTADSGELLDKTDI